jgi:16S rRNA processing protein RimM
MRRDPILVGRLGAAHGVRGEIRLRSFTGEPGAIARYGPLVDATGERSFVVEGLRPVKGDLFVAKLSGVSTRSAAEALTNIELFVPRAALPKPAPEEFYLADLIGLDAVTDDGKCFGRIVAVPDYGGGPLLEIAPAAGGESLLLPFTKQVVPGIDLERARVVVSPPATVPDEGIAPIEPGLVPPLRT